MRLIENDTRHEDTIILSGHKTVCKSMVTEALPTLPIMARCMSPYGIWGALTTMKAIENR